MKSIIIHKDDFTSYALQLGVWETILEANELPPKTTEVEIFIAKAIGI